MCWAVSGQLAPAWVRVLHSCTTCGTVLTTFATAERGWFLWVQQRRQSRRKFWRAIPPWVPWQQKKVCAIWMACRLKRRATFDEPVDLLPKTVGSPLPSLHRWSCYLMTNSPWSWGPLFSVRPSMCLLMPTDTRNRFPVRVWVTTLLWPRRWQRLGRSLETRHYDGAGWYRHTGPAHRRTVSPRPKSSAAQRRRSA